LKASRKSWAPKPNPYVFLGGVRGGIERICFLELSWSVCARKREDERKPNISIQAEAKKPEVKKTTGDQACFVPVLQVKPTGGCRWGLVVVGGGGGGGVRTCTR